MHCCFLDGYNGTPSQDKVLYFIFLYFLQSKHQNIIRDNEDVYLHSFADSFMSMGYGLKVIKVGRLTAAVANEIIGQELYRITSYNGQVNQGKS